MTKTYPPICVVDDDKSVREGVASLIRSAGWSVLTYSTAQEFLVSARINLPSCLVLDVDLPGLSGFDLQEELAKTNIRIPIIFLTGHGDIPMTVRALKAGARDFLTKPVDAEALLRAIREGIDQDLGRHQKRKPVRDGFEESMGTSASLQAALNKAAIVAKTDSTVLVLGETGTGKELIARSVHKLSPRSSKAFVSVNCAAIPQSLIASELFGHEKGAFTGALQRRLGRFELAEGGTIFLDEVGDLPEEAQLALLRVLQEHEFERVGGTHTIRTDVRVIAATHRDLQAAMGAGTFRSDLFYRLNVFPICLPPLRGRQEDIPLLVEHFIERYASRVGKRIQRPSEETLAALKAYPWPGNIRELQNVIERSVIVCETENFTLDASWVSQEPVPVPPAGDSLADSLEAREKEMIDAALAEAAGRVAGPRGAAAKLGIPASTLESKIKALKISKHRFKAV